MRRILILGVGGFIGSSIAAAALAYNPQWEIYGMDLGCDKIDLQVLQHPRFHFTQGDIRICKEWVENQIRLADLVLPLVAVATPYSYMTNPLQVFELDFEANLAIIRWCMQYHKRVIFPSTSETYGCASDENFDETTTQLVTGPIHEERWIYSSCKQLMDRIIWAYGKHHGLQFTIFRPFNWFGPKLDDPLSVRPALAADQATKSANRVVTQFIADIQYGCNLKLVNGGQQCRCFTYIEDGIDALIKIIENRNGCADQQIFNIGNPDNECSIAQLAAQLLELARRYPAVQAQANRITLEGVPAQEFYASGYADIAHRKPAIQQAIQRLNWAPKIDLQTGLRKTLDYYWKH